MLSKFYVTTPIYYANSEPHCGSAYTTIAADIVARYFREKFGKENVLSLVGTDEHGQKIAEEADKSGEQPKEYVDNLVPKFKKAWKQLNIDYDVFMRTTDASHEKLVKEVLQKIYDKGLIYAGEYEGWYCVGCEKFLTEKDLVDSKCPLHPNKKPVFQKEKNYFFKLKSFEKKLIDLFESEQVQILPRYRRNEILNRLKDGLEDISISREGVKWGIPVPWDNKHTVYVWVEALLNYYTATKRKEEWNKFWPADLHIVGKDILWFHTVIWNAILLAADLPLPETVFGHGFLTISGQKISKSLGNVIRPKDMVDRYGVDGARYLLMTTTNFGSDRDIKEGDFDEKYEADLANGLGNLVSRVAAMCSKEGVIAKKEDLQMDEQLSKLIEKYKIKKALDLVWGWIAKADKMINEKEVWTLESEEKKAALMDLVSRIRKIAYNLKIFLPETSEKIMKQYSREIKKEGGLFPRID